jgi:hypothetical protein
MGTANSLPVPESTGTKGESRGTFAIPPNTSEPPLSGFQVKGARLMSLEDYVSSDLLMIETYVAEMQRVLMICAGMFATEQSGPSSCAHLSCTKLGAGG